MNLDLLYTDVEDDLRASVRDLLAARCPAEKVIAVYDGDRSVVGPVWQGLAAELGLAGLLVPEDSGGAGASAREAAVVMEELGRAAAPAPYLTSAVVATAALLVPPVHMDGNDERTGVPVDTTVQTDELVAALASGERTAALAVPFSAGPTSWEPTVSVAGDALTGRVASVAGAVEADVLLVPVADEAGVALHRVDAPAVEVTPVVSLDMTRQVADVVLDGAAPEVVVPADAGGAAVRHALQLGAAMLASEQVGIAQWCLDSTVTYLKERRQFGRVVGGFQALKHRLADLYASVEQARAAARYAAATAAAGDADAEVAASVAQAYCSDVAVTAAEECIQLLGGLGMTWEHPAHVYLKRAKADQIGFGTAEEHRNRLAALVDLPG